MFLKTKNYSNPSLPFTTGVLSLKISTLQSSGPLPKPSTSGRIGGIFIYSSSTRLVRVVLHRHVSRPRSCRPDPWFQNTCYNYCPARDVSVVSVCL